MGLKQKEVANHVGVNTWTILNWEKGRTEPPIASIPDIIQFLGYDPFLQPKNLPQFLLTRRRAMGWSIKDAAEAVGVDPGTWGNWERGQTVLYRQHRVLLSRLLELSADTLIKEMNSNSSG